MTQAVRFVVALFLFSILAFPSRAEVRLPALFSDHMVVQRERPIPVWGWAAPGEEVVVQLNGQHVSAQTSEQGAWSVQLPALPAGGPYELTVRGGNQITIRDVLVGEVWLCSGQSNMEWILKETDDATAEIAASQNPRLRLFTVKRNVAETAQADVQGKWLPSDPSVSGYFSAVGYYFAKTLIADLDVPVGIINSSRGSSQILPWIPGVAIESNRPLFREDLDKWNDAVAKFPEAQRAYDAKVAQWQAKASTPPTPEQVRAKPQPPYGPGHYNTPGGLYNGMVAPLIPYAIRGVAWYQGEANAKRAAQYREAFPLLIRAWREERKEPELPFLFVQVAPYAAADFLPDGIERAELREAQRLALSLPNTGMVVTLDIGGPAEHPRNKKEVGSRLARVAERQVYGRAVEDSGPVAERLEIHGSEARVVFAHADGLKTTDGGEVKGFALAGNDGVFRPASARIEEKSVVVTCREVTSPSSVRYAWANLPVVNLINAAGLPTAPFCLDSASGKSISTDQK